MSNSAVSSDLEHFSDVITLRLGLQFEDAKLSFLSEVLHRRLDVLNRSATAYLRMLEKEPCNVELGCLAQELTVGETYFFRNIEQFNALAEVVLPDRMRAQSANKTLRILSAACASGEEPYSIAAIARETVVDPSWQIFIRAVDLNPAVLDKARRARYSSWSLRETSSEARRKWFRQDGRDSVLDESLRSTVSFQEGNIATDDAELWRPDSYDVVFCRNVLMYFAPEQARAVVARIARALAPGGYLFLGHAETLRGVSDDFHLKHTHHAFYYERKATFEPDRVYSAPAWPRIVSPVTPAETFGAAWVDAISAASERVEALVRTQGLAKRRVAPPRQTWDLGPVLDLLGKECFVEALATIRRLPPESDDDPDTLLLEAMLLAHGGDFPAAEAVCRRLLLIDELNAGAHYAMALCRESVGDREGAAEHDRVAAYLDPAFAMPRLHLGLLARHLGDRPAARRELALALVLLKREEPSRLLLFAGGFNREALVALCRSALLDCGGQA